ncbi:MAG: hypothetical protein ACFCA4_03395 [Cyanophyceae cyanobacterium]
MKSTSLAAATAPLPYPTFDSTSTQLLSIIVIGNGLRRSWHTRPLILLMGEITANEMGKLLP